MGLTVIEDWEIKEESEHDLTAEEMLESDCSSTSAVSGVGTLSFNDTCSIAVSKFSVFSFE